jgi:hypothetical protein
MKNALIFWMVCLKRNTAWWQTGTEPAGQGADWVDLRGFLLGVFEKEHGSR